MRRVLILLVLLFSTSVQAAQTVVSFDTLVPNSGEYVEDRSASDEAATFLNTYYESWGSYYWAGFAFSTVSNVVDGTYPNQYAAAQAHPNAYAVGYDDGGYHPAPEILLDLPAAPQSIRLNNTTYTAAILRDGNAYARAFTNGDFFVLTLTARDIDGAVLAVTNHALADFRDGESFIQTNWSELDLSWMPPEVVSIVGTLVTTDNGDWGANTPMYFAAADLTYAYADASGGIASTNPSILCWANEWSSYRPGTNVDAQWQTPSNALGAAKGTLGGLGSTNGIVSLGDNGWITLTFPAPITDGPGPDFAVYENAFSDTFLELAFVEVSSDGTNFVRFPSHCLETNWIDTYGMTNASDATAYGGFAGKNTQGFGTPFDLGHLPDEESLDTHRVTHVRIVDVLGNGTLVDSYDNLLFDPTPTWGSGGFDLDAIGVMNARIDISTDPGAPAPTLPGFMTVQEYTETLNPPTWNTHTNAPGTPGFYRYKLTR